MSEETTNRSKVSVLWFRHGLRLHDNPALLEAIRDTDEFYPIFIFDGESAGTKAVGYNRMCYLLEALNDLNEQFKKYGGKLYVFKGSPTQIFKRMWEELELGKICFEQDCEPLWYNRDSSVKTMCKELNINCVEKVSHTLWEPKAVIETNGGSPPLTYQMFLHTVSVIGPPPRPVSDVNWNTVTFGKLPDYLAEEFKMFPEIPHPEDFNIFREAKTEKLIRWDGGETKALKQLLDRLDVEESAFRQGYYLPNQAQPDLLGPPTSLSPALRFGCLSVRRKFPSISVPNKSTIHHLVCKVRKTGTFADKKRNRKRTVLTEEKLDDIGACFEQSPHKSLSKLTQQITHKDYNPHTLDELKENIRQQIALISMDELQRVFRNFRKRCEACIRHGGRHVHDLFNEVHKGEPPACQNITGQLIWREYFYTMSVNNEFYAEMERNPICLNIPWHDGGDIETGHLAKWKQGKTGFPFIDAVMRQLLQIGQFVLAIGCGFQVLLLNNFWIVHIVSVLSIMDVVLTHGEIIRYVPELNNYPVEYLYEPWKAPIEVQEKAGCVVGRDYPERIVDHLKASEQNRADMNKIILGNIYSYRENRVILL
ncbi:Cryptochrome-1 [Blattella germanica]|nr:Cryptochrome-1 [Blattella germanica]